VCDAECGFFFLSFSFLNFFFPFRKHLLMNLFDVLKLFYGNSYEKIQKTFANESV
jgi:hypothetical protein